MDETTRKLINDLMDELEAADIIIADFDTLAKEGHIDRSFTLRKTTRAVMIAKATAALAEG